MDEYSVGGLTLAGALGAAWAWIRRRRKKGKGSWRPRMRFQGYLSMRTHESSPSKSLEPPPFDERDTGKRRGLKRGGEDE